MAGLGEVAAEISAARPGLSFHRVPVVEESAPREECFDIMVQALKGENSLSLDQANNQLNLSDSNLDREGRGRGSRQPPSAPSPARRAAAELQSVRRSRPRL